MEEIERQELLMEENKMDAVECSVLLEEQNLGTNSRSSERYAVSEIPEDDLSTEAIIAELRYLRAQSPYIKGVTLSAEAVLTAFDARSPLRIEEEKIRIGETNRKQHDT